VTQTVSEVIAADWVTCDGCGCLVYARRFIRQFSVCPSCGHHARLTAPERLAALLDEDTIRPLGPVDTIADPLQFVDEQPYAQRLAAARVHTGLCEAVVAARGLIEGHPVVLAAMDFRFLGGSLGSAEGERIVAAAEVALADRVPFIVVTASGGARMQEGALSLMQMAKTSQALAELDEAGILTVSVISDPTYGGVAASFATLTDIVLAEPGARLGFAGPRVIEQTIKQRLPENFQTAEFLFARGLVDDVRHRNGLRATLAELLSAVTGTAARGSDVEDPIVRDPALLAERDAWAAVNAARDTGRPTSLEYAAQLLDGFVELHGDRLEADCPAVVGGPGLLDGVPVMFIGQQKGHTVQERVNRNFGMPTPAGYRKAARLMRLAAKLRLPVVTLVDTPGAYPGIEAEERGQAFAVAANLSLMSRLPVPIVTVVTGEGGSGGALALAVADRVLMQENAVLSVISPEGCAAILWRTAGEARRAAQALGLDARSLLAAGIVHGVVPEPPGGAPADRLGAANLLRGALHAALDEVAGLAPEQLVHERRCRYRAYGRPVEHTDRQEARR
jgi:acyl-CoA carboxylase subunit beta